MRIQHNIMAMNAYRNYNNNTSALSKNLEKLSSGYKINRAGDDAAGLAISEKMRAQITGLDVAQKNAKDGISLVQTAEGALTEVHDMLNRMYELAEQSANGTYEDETDRAQLQKEITQLKDEINRIADATNFNGINLLDGSLSSKGVSSTGGAGDYLMLDAGSNKITISKNQTINAATTNQFVMKDLTGNASVTKLQAETANSNGFMFEVRYLDEAGVEQTKTLTVDAGTQWASEDAVAAAIQKAIEDANIGLKGVAASTAADDLGFTSSTAGSSGAKILGIAITKTGIWSDGTNGTTVDSPSEIVADDTKFVQGKDKDVSNKIAFDKNFAIGDTITIGDKTYEFADPSGINNVKEGNVAVAIGLDGNGKADQADSIKNLVNALIANGVNARVDVSDTNNKTVLIDDLSEISINRPSIDVKVDSADITTGNANATQGIWQVEAGAGTAQETNLTIKYLDADGKEQTRTITYTGAAAAKDNATAIANAISSDSVLKELFKVETVTGTADGDTVRLTAIQAGSNAPKALSIVTNDAAGTAIAKSFTQVSEGKDAAAGIVVGDNVKAGDTITVAGKTFEFVAEGDVNKVSNGNYAVVIGSDGKKTAANLNQALQDVGFTTSYLKDTNGIRVVENDFSLSGGSNATGGGLTLQIGDTGEEFNQLNVSINDCHTQSLGIDNLDIGDQKGATAALETIKSAINYVSDVRGTLGATQNRLDHTINNLSVMQENIQDAESSIRDTDVADEMMEYTKNNILIQSAQAMLAQANQVPQGVLQLLQ